MAAAQQKTARPECKSNNWSQHETTTTNLNFITPRCMMPAGFSTPCRGLQAKALTKPYLRQKHTRGAVDVSKPSGTTKCASSLISPSSNRVQSRRRTITLVTTATFVSLRDQRFL